MTPQQFAQTIRSKYPNGVTSDGLAYSEISDEELTHRVTEKYPVYKSQVQIASEGKGNDPIGSPVDAVKEFVSGVGRSIEERTTSGAQEVIKAKKGEINPASAALRVTGQAAGGVGDVSFEALKLIAPKIVEDMVASGVEAVGETELAQTALSRYEELKTKHPEAMKDVEAVFNIASLIPVAKGTQVATKGVAKTAQKVSRLTGKALEARRIGSIDNAMNEINSVVGKIVQGKKGDIERAKKALSSIDTTDVKTYTDLRDKLDDGIEALANKVDDALDNTGASIGSLKSENLVTTTQVGKTTVSQNFIDDALNQLDELYTKIKDSPNKARINEVRNKLTTEGLTLRELNDLAREYNLEFGNKAFSSRTGEALTSVNAQAYENTRKGIKEVVRNKIPDDVTKMLDQRMSEMLNTRRLTIRMEEKVNALYQRAKKRGIMERIARKTADIVDIATFNTVSGFISRMLPSNVGLKVMNSIDLEDALRKNLKKMDHLLKTTNDKLVEDEIVKMLKNNKTPVKSRVLPKTQSGIPEEFEPFTEVDENT